MESVSVLVNLQVLQETDCLAFLPRVIALDYLKLGALTILEALDEWAMPAVGLVTRSEARQAPALQTFTQLVRQAGNEIAEARRK